VSAPLPTIDATTLRCRLDSGERLWLVHAPGATSFGRAHIRGAVAFADADHARAVLRRDDEVVVYGPDAGCRASPALVRDLRRHGYRQVAWLAGGLREWAALGGAVEGSASASHLEPTQDPADRERRER
jgi:3-mercaptopyruvate sulfurtransferase SseA